MMAGSVVIFFHERRRLRGDLTYNIFHGPLDLSHAGEAQAQRDLPGHNSKVRHGSFRLLQREATFMVRFSIA